MSDVSRVYPAQLMDLASSVARYAAPVFAAKQHEWRGLGVPDEPQIAACVMHLLEHVACGSTSSTGGFIVERFVEDDVERYEVRLTLGSCAGPEPKG